MEIYVHPRITQKHPQLSEEDIKVAFRNMFRHVRRDSGEYVGIGSDSRQRLIQMVFTIGPDVITVYHGFTPPTDKALAELRMKR